MSDEPLAAAPSLQAQLRARLARLFISDVRGLTSGELAYIAACAYCIVGFWAWHGVVDPAVSTQAVAVCIGATGLLALAVARPVAGGLRLWVVVAGLGINVALLPSIGWVWWLAVPPLIALCFGGRTVRWGATAAIIAIAVVSLATMVVWGHVDIDVYPMLKTAPSDLLHGLNPYQRLYTLDVVSSAFPEHASLLLPSPYPPALYFVLAPLSAFGEPRITEWILMAAAAGFLWVSAKRAGLPSRTAQLVGVLALISPISILMALLGFSDSLVLVFVFLWWKKRNNSAWWGLLLVVVGAGRPSLVMLLLPLFARYPTRYWRHAAVAVPATLAVLLPFTSGIGITALLRDLTEQFQQPLIASPEATGVTLDAVALHLGLPTLSPLAFRVGAAAVALVAVIAARRVRAPSALGMLGAALSAAIFLLSPYAHINYFWPLGLWLLLMACEAAGEDRDASPTDRSPTPAPTSAV